jgi:hypothetical protein
MRKTTEETNGVKSSLRLPATLAVGFTGHRLLHDEANCRKWIYDFLKRKKVSARGVVHGVSSLAAGGDLLFAECCFELELPLCVLLPLPVEGFRKDFDDRGWARVEQALSKAASVEVAGGDQPRNECYYECGIETVLQSQMLLALWNGAPAEGLGGTEDIVTFAKELGRTVVWLHSVSGEVSAFNEKSDEELADDAELEFLNNLPDLNVTADTDAPHVLARAWFRKVDESATRSAPQFRRLAAIPIIFTAAAALFSGAGSWARSVGAWLAAGTAMGILAAILPAALRLQKKQILWARTRTAAEVCRSVLAFWSAPAPYDAIGPEVVPELSGMLVSLNLLKSIDRESGKASLAEFKERYRRERVAGQIDYMFSHAAQSEAEGRRYRIATWACIGLAIALNAWLFVGARFFGIVFGEWKQWMALGASVAFQIATVAGALLAVNDCDRRRQRYRELHRQLEKWDAQLVALRTWPSVLRVAGRIERALLTELIEWRSLIRNHKHARK